MLINGWTVVRFLHVLSAAVWVGGLIVLTFYVNPTIKTGFSEEEAAPVVTKLGKRVGITLMAVLLPILIATGTALLVRRHVGAATLLSTNYGRMLFLKLCLVVVVVVVAAVHGVVTSRGQKTLSRVLSISTVVISILILGCAVALVP